jgi:hypothetical protein
LIFLLLSFLLLVVVGRVSTSSFGFLLNDFWFASGVLLLLLLSLIDQPFFSKDANIFVNGVTGGVSLLIAGQARRDVVWWTFFAWTVYLVVSSYSLMWLRSKEVASEGRLVRENRGPVQVLTSF